MSTTVVKTYTPTPFTIDLTAFCACGAPCPACCVGCGTCFGVPTTLFATITSEGTDCRCMAGQVWTLIYDAGTLSWKGSLQIDGLCLDTLPTTFMNLKMFCSSGTWALQIDTDGGTHSCLTSEPRVTTPSSSSCSPFQVVFLSQSIQDCCDGPHAPNVVWTVTP